MTIHQKFSVLLNRLAVTPNIVRTRKEDAQRREFAAISREIDAGVERAISHCEKRLAEVEKALS